jgi:(R,R)-butanediol dehydrogenase/meso-butanediol dehydrogenase/diacetyl reductase
MKALRWHAQKDIRVEDIPEPSPAPGQVKVKVKWCGICGSDIHEYIGGPMLIKTTKPHPMPGSKMAPVVIGHEFSGQVVEVGEGVTNINVGDRVTVRPTIPCYKCHWCRRGEYVQCAILGSIGFVWDGGFAEYMVAPSDNIFKLPDSVTYEMGAFAEPFACTVHAVNRAHIPAGATVAIVGGGPIGLLAMQAAKAVGAGQVFIVETLAKRIELAKQLGATAVFNPDEVDAGKEIGKLTERRRADIVMECAGPCSAMLSTLTLGARGGTILEMGQMMEPCSFPFATLFGQEKSIITSQGYKDEFPVAISLMANGAVNTDAMITAKVSLNDVIEKGFKELTGEHRLDHCKILVSPEL